MAAKSVFDIVHGEKQVLTVLGDTQRRLSIPAD
jgi:hypothetical protein